MTSASSIAGEAPGFRPGVLSESGNVPLPAPLQLIKLALNDCEAAKERFPDYRLTRLVVARFDLNERDLMQFSNLVGDEGLRLDATAPRPFNDHLRNVIARYGLGALFSDDGPGLYHHAIRPTGYDFIRDEVIPRDMERWRANYRDMSDERQMLAASIVWLYRAGKDNVWLRRVPCTWHAADAISCMNKTGAFRDWVRLLVLYPGC